MRADAERDVEHRLGRGHFEIERLLDRGLEAAHVLVVDVAPVLAQMRGDAVRSGVDGDEGRADRIGKRPAARVAHGGDMVDVDAQAKRGHRMGRLFIGSVPSSIYILYIFWRTL